MISSQRELVDVADLVGVHEARVAHHVAAVGQVDGEHRAAAVLDRRAAVLAQRRRRRQEVAARDRAARCAASNAGSMAITSVKVAVLRARLLHDDLAVLLDDLGLDLAGLAVDELAQRALAVEDRGAHLLHAARAERVGLARPAELREGALAALEQRRRRPVGLRRRALEAWRCSSLTSGHAAARGGGELLDVANEIHRLFLSPPTRVCEQATCPAKCAKRRGTPYHGCTARVHAGRTACGKMRSAAYGRLGGAPKCAPSLRACTCG